MTFGQRVRERRKDLGLLLDDLVKTSGLSKGFLSDVENDKRSVGLESLKSLSEALGVSVQFLVDGKPEISMARTEVSLKTCPFCGQKGQIVLDELKGEYFFSIGCESHDCFVWVGRESCGYPMALLQARCDKWNKRS